MASVNSRDVKFELDKTVKEMGKKFEVYLRFFVHK